MNAKLEERGAGLDEQFYQLGYGAALHAKYRGKEYDQIMSEMQSDLEELRQCYPGIDVEKAYIKGFEQGRIQEEAKHQHWAPSSFVPNRKEL